MFKFYHAFLVVILLYIGGVSSIKNENGESVKEFRYCLRKSEHPNLRECVGRAAINLLQRLDERDNFALADNFIAARDDTISARTLVNFLDTDPIDFRGILENAGAVFSQRSLEYHMDAIYPGLMFKIGPSADSSSVAQFMLDPTVNQRKVNYEEPSTARILTRHYVLPFLLGLKFNLVALVPILFTVICLLLKKALFIAKLVLFISSVLGVGGIASALGKFGGFNSLFGGYDAGALPHPLAHPPPHLGAAFAGTQIGGALGAFPGKNTVYSQYEEDELQHVSPYKRQDRKVVFGKVIQNTGRPNANKKNYMHVAAESDLVTPPVDHFYEYEKQVYIPQRSGNGRTSTATLTANTYNDAKKDEALGVSNKPASSLRFQSSDNNGWKVLNIRA